MENIKIEKVMVELEDTDDGRKKLKRLKNGLHPIEVLGEIIAEDNDAFRRQYGRDLLDWGSYEERGEDGERPHYVFVLYSRETGEKVPIRRFILWNQKEDKPIPIPEKVLGKPGMKTMARKDTLEHAGNYLDFTKIRARAEERGLHIQSSASWNVLEKAKRRMEG
jgi:hypothetical protein